MQGDYQLYTPITSTTASLSFPVHTELTRAFAGDCSRFAVAAIETIEGIRPSEALPKGTAWLAIRTYYAAFFAAHSLLRTLGVSCTKLGLDQTSMLNQVAGLFGASAGTQLLTGLYECRVDTANHLIAITQLQGRGGSHTATWGILYRELTRLSAAVLAGGLPRVTAQRASSTIDQLRAALDDHGTVSNGSWMSQIRNRVNYDLDFGAWHPYHGRSDYYDQLYVKAQAWRTDPTLLSIWPHRTHDLTRLIDTSTLLVSLCREVCIDLAARCPRGKSFQEYGCVGLLNQLAA